jgi:glycosyltransferase involved in cell wall biosynthesis
MQPGGKVVHVVEQLHRGAVESWLVRMLRHARRQNRALDWTFYCALGEAGSHDEEARSLGARVVHSPVPIGKKLEFVRALRRELGREGYDVLHAHHDLVSGVYLAAAIGLPIRRRIVQVHNADEHVLTPSRFKQRLYREPLRRVCLGLADRVVGISGHTLDTFLAGRPRQPARDRVLHYGVDPAPFMRAVGDRAALRNQLGLAEDALVLLLPGRIVPEKNPLFAVDVLAELRRFEPRAVAVFAGAGALEPAVQARAQELGVASATRLLGFRTDVAELMSASDVFLLPHVEHAVEGFGLAVVEAQLGGLRLLLSNGVADDPLLPTARFRRLPLAAGAQAWAAAARELFEGAAPSRSAALAALGESPMDMDRALDGLLALHT